ncbi:MAG TPA: Hsp33 family molecular chaperone HslO, partial [Polyangiaceae bacterium]|nr:Hsp33 family molecular chaperone HslO [Polyangiaceae bacterium]
MESNDTVLRAITDDGAFRVIVARTTDTVQSVLKAQGAQGATGRHLGDLVTGSVLFRETMAPNLRVQGILKGAGGSGSLVADSHPSGKTRGLVQLATGKSQVEIGSGAIMQMMRTLPDGKINQGFVEVPGAGGISRALMEYMQTSEQVVSMLAMGTLLDEERVSAAGGYLVQLLPEAPRGPLMVMTERLKDFESIDAQLKDEHFTPA